MATTVQQRKRSKGWRKPEGSVSVTRPGRWGNPFRVVPVDRWSGGRKVTWWRVEKGTWRSQLYADHAAATDWAVELFAGWLWTSDEDEARWMRAHIDDLRDRILLCWCDGPPCHAYVLADMAQVRALERSSKIPTGETYAEHVLSDLTPVQAAALHDQLTNTDPPIRVTRVAIPDSGPEVNTGDQVARWSDGRYGHTRWTP